ncbi:MAG: PAS domain-containing protein [Pelagimonas sp.]|jgi:aerotaxis receptor|nr:PAS domain-containing protein [Pelagimonas sp.]
MSSLDPKLTDVGGNEAAFSLNELFYSFTDERGVIQTGNAVFQRVSGYSWSELVGSPHNLVRHPDMPKGLFHMFWERLKAGEPVGAYVKNMRKGGRFYWVFSLVLPVEDGYLSIRLKPTSSMFQKVSEIYTDVRQNEQENGLTPAQSAAYLEEKIGVLGFASYADFQADALSMEFDSRLRQLGRHEQPLQRRFSDMSEAIQQVLMETSEMTEAFKAIRTVPMNMRIIASRLENAGGPISAISVNYSQMLEEMSTWVNTFVDGDTCAFARIRSAIHKGQFLSYAIALEEEMLIQFQSEEVHEGNERSHQKVAEQLREHSAKFVEDMSTALVGVESEAKRFARSVLDMKRYVTGLSSTRMMCKIESAALANSGTALTGIVEQLDVCQNEIEERLAKIVELNSVIQSNTAMLRSLV